MFIIIEHEGDEVKGIVAGFTQEFAEFENWEDANKHAESVCVDDYTIVEIM